MSWDCLQLILQKKKDAQASSMTTLQVKQHLKKEKEHIRELQAMTEESCKLMREKQQLQQELLVASTRLEDLQQQLQQQVSDMTHHELGLPTVDFTEEERCSSFVIRNVGDRGT